MKKLLSVLTFFALAISFSYAQENVDQAPTEATDGAKMVFEVTEINYGEIEQHADPYRYFKFKNTGNEPLVIQHAKGSCGCTVPKYPKEPILPGESAQIEVRYDTKRLGPFTKTVTLTTNAVNNSPGKPKGTFVLTIKGKIHPKPAEPEGVPASNGGFGNNNN
ncbi:MAG: DUF1573 domain-containing protein [Bacteroidetes bacterium]|nr:MAG: DUF1573 domain-containing protein [Bacteroidota bacterium]